MKLNHGLIWAVLLHIAVALITWLFAAGPAVEFQPPAAPLNFSLQTIQPASSLPRPEPQSVPEPSPARDESPSNSPYVEYRGPADLGLIDLHDGFREESPSPGATEVAPERVEAPSRPMDRLPKAGVIQMQAYLGRYSLDAEPLGAGQLEMIFPSDDQYEIALIARAQGWASFFVRDAVSFVSKGKLSQSGLRPEYFHAQTPFRGKVTSHFDHRSSQGFLDGSSNPTVLPDQFQDRLSVIFQLAWMAQAHSDAMNFGQRHILAVATRQGFREATFTVEGSQDLVLPGGILVSAIRLVSDPIKGRREGHIEVWLDPADRFLPARMLFVEASGQAVDFLAIRPVF